MSIKYEDLSGFRTKFSIKYVKDFSPKQSDKIILNLVKKIEEYGQKANRNIQTNYFKYGDGTAKRIVEVIMNSKDDIIQGTINYIRSAWIPVSMFASRRNGTVVAKFNFNSNDESLKNEYQGLSKILQKI